MLSSGAADVAAAEPAAAIAAASPTFPMSLIRVDGRKLSPRHGSFHHFLWKRFEVFTAEMEAYMDALKLLHFPYKRSWMLLLWRLQ